LTDGRLLFHRKNTEHTESTETSREQRDEKVQKRQSRNDQKAERERERERERYTCTNQPVIGTTWLAQIGRTINTVGTFLVVAPGGASPPVPFLNGELLVQVSPAPIVLAVPSSFGLGIPAQASNIGVTLATQGLRAENIGPAVVAQLLNAIDLRFGL
jgi:hypothetical protein